MPLIPINTDAPLYHFPCATIGLVVEGKLGWRVFLPLYLGMAAAWGSGVDLLTLHRTDAYVLRSEFDVETLEELKAQIADSIDESELPPGMKLAAGDDIDGYVARHLLNLAKGHCLGASGVIFSLMAISLVWAPKNEMHIIGFLFFRAVSFDVTIMVCSLWYLALNILELLLTQSKRPTAALQTLKGLSLAGVNEQLQALAKKIVRTAKEQVRSGVQDEEPEW